MIFSISKGQTLCLRCLCHLLHIIHRSVQHHTHAKILCSLISHVSIQFGNLNTCNIPFHLLAFILFLLSHGLIPYFCSVCISVLNGIVVEVLVSYSGIQVAGNFSLLFWRTLFTPGPACISNQVLIEIAFMVIDVVATGLTECLISVFVTNLYLLLF
jgi:hypothetical protein